MAGSYPAGRRYEPGKPARGGPARNGPRPSVETMRTAARYRDLIHEGARFCVVGAGGVVVTDGGTNLLRTVAGMSWLNASVLATVAAIAFTYAGSRYWTFRHRAAPGCPGSRCCSSAWPGGPAHPARLPRRHRARARRLRAAGRQRRPVHRHRAGHRVPVLGLPPVGLASGRGQAGAVGGESDVQLIQVAA